MDRLCGESQKGARPILIITRTGVDQVSYGTAWAGETKFLKQIPLRQMRHGQSRAMLFLMMEAGEEAWRGVGYEAHA